MKKILWLLFILVLVICGCQKQPEDQAVMDRVNGIVAIEYEDLVTKIAENHDFLLYIGRADCRDCIEFEPELKAFLEENPDLGIYYLDVKAFRDAARKEDASQAEKDFFKTIQETLNYDWTPTLQHRQGEKLISNITYLDEAYYALETEDEQQAAKRKSLEDIWQWLRDNA